MSHRRIQCLPIIVTNRQLNHNHEYAAITRRGEKGRSSAVCQYFGLERTAMARALMLAVIVHYKRKDRLLFPIALRVYGDGVPGRLGKWRTRPTARRPGHRKYEWTKEDRQRNEAWDCLVYAFSALINLFEFEGVANGLQKAQKSLPATDHEHREPERGPAWRNNGQSAAPIVAPQQEQPKMIPRWKAKPQQLW